MAFAIGLVCDTGVGPERGGRSRNEDNFLVCADGRVRYLRDGEAVSLPAEGAGVLLAVCDGMGGHDDGHVAAQAAVEVMAKLYQPDPPGRPARVLRRYIREAHGQLHERARCEGKVSMGTTLTACWLLDGRCAWAHVGDSRLYLLRGQQLLRLTTDHTRNTFALRDGRGASPQGAHLAQSFIFGSRGLGDDTRLRLDPGRDSGLERLERGDRLLLCSDGIHDALSPSELARVLGELYDPQETADHLRDLAVHHGSTDNLTALVVRVDEVPELPALADVDDDDITLL